MAASVHILLFLSPLALTLKLMSSQELLVDYPDRLLHLEEELFVAARDRLLVVDPQTLERTREDVLIPAPANTVTKCRRLGRSVKSCANYHRVLVVRDNSSLFVCGTNAFDPHCDFRLISNLSVILPEAVPDDDVQVYRNNRVYFSLCPFDPEEGNTAMIIGNRYYAATQLHVAPYNAFYKVNLDGTDLAQTPTANNDDWVAPSNFYAVKMFEYGDSIFVVYRETATEVQSTTVYTRIAKVCKDDEGSKKHVVYPWRWQTFVKATLVCAVNSGSRTYDYNEIVSVSDVFELNGESHIVGVFRSVDIGPPASAVCLYRMKDVVNIYKKPYRYRDMNGWKVITTEPSVDCSNIVPQYQYALIADPLHQTANRPLILESYGLASERLSQVAVLPSVKALNGSDCFVMFIGTENGDMVRSWSCGDSAEIFDRQRVFTADGGVRGLELYTDLGKRQEASLYMSGSAKLRRVSVFTCNYTHLNVCVSDPLCAWYIPKGQCIIRPENYTTVKNATKTYPNITVTPVHQPIKPSAETPHTSSISSRKPTSVTSGAPITDQRTSTTVKTTDTIATAATPSTVDINPRPGCTSDMVIVAQLESGDDSNDVSVAKAAGIGVGTWFVGLILGLFLGWLFFGPVCGWGTKGKRVSVDIAAYKISTSRNGSESQVKLQRQMLTGSFLGTGEQPAYHVPSNCTTIPEEQNGIAYTEPVAEPLGPSPVMRITSETSAYSSKELLDSPSSEEQPRSGEMA